jgi:hypothetical protein
MSGAFLLEVKRLDYRGARNLPDSFERGDNNNNMERGVRYWEHCFHSLHRSRPVLSSFPSACRALLAATTRMPVCAAGGLMSGALFQYPGAVVMTLVGAGAAKFLTDPPGWLEGIVAGLSAVGVALVASASKGLLMKLCNTNVSRRDLRKGRGGGLGRGETGGKRG